MNVSSKILGETEKAPADDSEDAAKDILAAVKSGDASALNLALKRHYATCEGEDDEPDEDDDTDEAPPSSKRY